MITTKDILNNNLHNFIDYYIDSLDPAMKNDDKTAEKLLLNSISQCSDFYPSWIRLAGVYHSLSLTNWSLLCYLKGCEEKDTLNKVNPLLSPDMKMIFRNADIEIDGLSVFFQNCDELITLDEDSLVDMRLELSKDDPLSTLIEKIIETKDKRYMVTIGGLPDEDDEDEMISVGQHQSMPLPIMIKLEAPDDVENKELLRKLKHDISELNNTISILDANIMRLIIDINSFKSENTSFLKRIYNRLFKRNKRLAK